MIAIDTNLLVYAHRAESSFHADAARSITELAEGRGAWAIPWPCVHEFYSIVTHPGIFTTPTPVDLALRQIDIWLEAPGLHLLGESDQHWPLLRKLLGKGKVPGPMVHDARIAALCLSHGVSELWSADRDFNRFPSLRVRNPLAE